MRGKLRKSAEGVDSFAKRSGSDVRRLVVDCELDEDTRAAGHSLLVVGAESEGDYDQLVTAIEIMICLFVPIL